MLSNSLTKRLVFEENLNVLQSKFLSLNVLLPLIGVLLVANTIQVSKRVSRFFIVESA